MTMTRWTDPPSNDCNNKAKSKLRESASAQTGGKLNLVNFPADAAVAATCFGASESAKDKRPRPTLDAPQEECRSKGAIND
jgi:hypothetical protein